MDFNLLTVRTWVGFGSCYSFGCRGGFARLWHVPNAWGKYEHNLLKNAKDRLYYFLSVPRYNFLKAQVVSKPFTCPREKSLLVKCRPFFGTQICPGSIATNVCVSSVVRFRSRVLSPTPNVERRYKLWITPHRTIAETFCCMLLGFVR